MNLSRVFLVVGLAALAGYAYWRFAIPVHRVEVHSELIMLGDLNGDRKWTAADLEALRALQESPFAAKPDDVGRLDLNQNGVIDEEDLQVLQALAAAGGDPYTAAEAAQTAGTPFPRPRELYRYVQVDDYRQRPLWGLEAPPDAAAVLPWLPGLRARETRSAYGAALNDAVYSESLRFLHAWRRREPQLVPVERQYAEGKLARARRLHEDGHRFELLLAMIELVEDAETLTVRNQPRFLLQLLAFRDHLRQILGGAVYADFEAGRADWKSVLGQASAHLKTDLEVNQDLANLGKARDFSSLENYVQRTEWQYYKSAAGERDFRALIQFAQHDRRYLHAVSRTHRRSQDPMVENHNLPMVLLFREAMRIKGGDKKRAVGLLDEAIRIPYAWVRSIPRESLPSSLALENFLLPGNKEDGADKSRHWNVFGGICLYKSPQEALELALKREVQDLREAGYSKEAMREFFRDMIANLNGMYHVMTVEPGLLHPQS